MREYTVNIGPKGYDEDLAEFYLNDMGMYPSIYSVSRICEAIRTLYNQIPVDVTFVQWEPYDSVEDMRKYVEEFGVLLVSSLHNESPYFNTAVNLQFRAVHDYYNHYCDELDFDLNGEYQSFLALTSRMRGLHEEDISLLFSEMVLQANAALSLDGGYLNPRFSQKFVPLHV